MIKPKFKITLEKFNVIHELPNSWSINDYKSILDLVDFELDEGTEESELFDYLSLALQDIGAVEASALLLKYRLGTKLNDGQIQDISHDIQDENLWEEYQDMSLHEELFNITSLLYRAFNGKFPEPDAAEISTKIEALNHSAQECLNSFDESLIARIIAKGQTEHAIINRLFDEKVDGDSFEEAKDIIWQYSIVNKEDKSVTIDITTAIYWVKELKNVNDFETETFNDGH